MGLVNQSFHAKMCILHFFVCWVYNQHLCSESRKCTKALSVSFIAAIGKCFEKYRWKEGRTTNCRRKNVAIKTWLRVREGGKGGGGDPGVSFTMLE
jgi:hypothetical protein